MTKYILFFTSTFLALPVLSSNDLTISCVEYGSDQYKYTAQIRGGEYQYTEDHQGNVTRGSLALVSVAQEANTLKIVAKDGDAQYLQTNVYELRGSELSMHTVTTSNGEVVGSQRGVMSTQCVAY